MIKAVIFDLDGVLVDSEVFSGRASEQVLEKFVIELTPEEEENSFGRRDLDIFRDAISARGLDLKPEDLVNEKDRLYSLMIRGKLRPLPGARQALESLRKRGIPFAVASSGTRKKIMASLTETGLLELIDTIVSGDEIERGKPHPDIFLKAAGKLGASSGDCLVVEDAQAGIEAAKAAGMACLAIKSPNTHGQDLSRADHIISSLKELEENL